MRFWTCPWSRCGNFGRTNGLSLWPVIVTAALWGLVPLAEPADGPPQVGAASIWTDGPTLVYGENLDGELSYWLYSPPRDTKYTDADLRASLERVLAGEAQALPSPPANARWAKTSSQDRYTAVLDVDVRRTGGFAAIIPQGTPFFGAGAVLWLKNGHGAGKPYILKEAEIWGANPAKAPPGETLTVWGVNLSYGYGLVTSEGQVAAILRAYRAYGHSCRFEERFWNLLPLPPNLPPGRYRLYNWGGLGDTSWSEPLELRVAAMAKTPPVYRVTDFGAKGDGVSDDTPALQRALAHAASQGGGRVYLPGGRYAITQSLSVPPDVTLCGESRDSTTIEASRWAPFTTPKAFAKLQAGLWRPRKHSLVRLQERTGLENLTLEVPHSRRLDDPELGGMGALVLVQGDDAKPVEDVVVDRCRLLASRLDVYGRRQGHDYCRGIQSVSSPLRHFRFTRTEFHNNAEAIYLRGPHCDGSISFNRIAQPDPHSANIAMAIAGQRILVQGNVFENTARIKTGGGWRFSPLPKWRSCWLHNVFRNARKSDGEMLSYEGGGARAWGPAAGGDERHLKASPAQPWKPDQWRDHRVMIVAGCGMAQIRWITSNTADTLEVAKPWQVPPNETSQFLITGRGTLENLHVGNEYLFCNAWSGLRTGVRNVWVDEVMEMVGGGHYAWRVNGPAALNLYLGNRYCQRARLVFLNGRYEGKPDSRSGLPMVFGNEARHCTVIQPGYAPSYNRPDGGLGHARRKAGNPALGNPLVSTPGEEPGIGIFDHLEHIRTANAEDPRLDEYPISTRWNLIASNLFHLCPVGVRIGRRVERTVLWNNTYCCCGIPVRDAGIGTREEGTVVGKALPNRAR